MPIINLSSFEYRDSEYICLYGRHNTKLSRLVTRGGGASQKNFHKILNPYTTKYAFNDSYDILSFSETDPSNALHSQYKEYHITHQRNSPHVYAVINN